jgi:hypothetical protein
VRGARCDVRCARASSVFCRATRRERAWQRMGAVAPPIDVATEWRCSGGRGTRGTGDVGRVLFDGTQMAAIGD